jgi:hypothetical protein
MPNVFITDPLDTTRIFSWLISQSHDDKGNVIVYNYKAENSENVDLFHANELNRTDQTRSANRYLKRIRWKPQALSPPTCPQSSLALMSEQK